MSKYTSRNSLRHLITLIKELTKDLVTFEYNADTKFLKFKSKEKETNINLTLPELFSPGDVVYKCKADKQFIGGHKWVKLNGAQLNIVDFRKLYSVIGDAYNTETTKPNYFSVPNLWYGGVIGSCNQGNDFGFYGKNSISIAKRHLPKIDILSEGGSAYASYNGHHNHQISFKTTNKSGRDTATVYSSMEDIHGTVSVYTDTSSDSYIGKHQHVLQLNSMATPNTFNIQQQTYICGNYYMYTGEE